MGLAMVNHRQVSESGDSVSFRPLFYPFPASTYTFSLLLIGILSARLCCAVLCIALALVFSTLNMNAPNNRHGQSRR
jgi:hypothetical protein